MLLDHRMSCCFHLAFAAPLRQVGDTAAELKSWSALGFGTGPAGGIGVPSPCAWHPALGCCAAHQGSKTLRAGLAVATFSNALGSTHRSSHAALPADIDLLLKQQVTYSSRLKSTGLYIYIYHMLQRPCGPVVGVDWCESRNTKAYSHVKLT